MESPPMPQLTPDQLQKASAYLPIEQILMAAAYLNPDMLRSQIDNIDQDQGPRVLAAAVIVSVLATSAVAVRLACRRHLKVAVSYDDYIIIIGLVIAVVQCVLQGYSVALGTGKHLIRIGLADTKTYVKVTYAFQFLMSASMIFIKLSILLFYRRLFPRENTTARWRTCHWSLCIASVGVGVIQCFGIAFQCTPVAYFWDRTIPGGHCINMMAFFRFANIANLLTDILILAMPIPIVWSLRLDRQKKFGVCGLFLLGGFVCVASIMRFYYLESVGKGVDPTWDNVDVMIWSTVEPCVGVVCACLPVMGPLLRTHIMSFTTSVFRSDSKWSKEASSGFSAQSGSAHTGASRDRKSFGKIGERGKGGGGHDEEMGIPLKEASGVYVREVSTSGS
ncbi:hypothetical protein XANCAGTX0491_003418 [Xanthoria calcicola]